MGGLIQTAVGICGGLGRWRTNRSGVLRKAGSSAVWRGLAGGVDCLGLPATALVATLAKAYGKGRLVDKLSQLANPKLLIVDEVGYLPFEPDAAHLFVQLVSRRYERGALLVTSNRAIGEWGTVFGDLVVATAILDRMLHHSHVVTIRGESDRLREKRRSGLLQKAAPAQTNNRENQMGVSSS